MELRTTQTKVEVRSDEENSRTVEGYALKFDTRSQPLADNYLSKH
jgi:hypothetical protein